MKPSGYSPQQSKARILPTAPTSAADHTQESKRGDTGMRCNSGLRAGENVWHKHNWINLLSLLEIEGQLAAMSTCPRNWVGLVPLKSYRERHREPAAPEGNSSVLQHSGGSAGNNPWGKGQLFITNVSCLFWTASLKEAGER